MIINITILDKRKAQKNIDVQTKIGMFNYW